jgi:hypothetical protein
MGMLVLPCNSTHTRSGVGTRGQHGHETVDVYVVDDDVWGF